MLIGLAHESLARGGQVAGGAVWLDGHDLHIRETAPVPNRVPKAGFPGEIRGPKFKGYP
jgi:hypothetical protein